MEKVVKVSDVEVVKKRELKKQDVVIGDGVMGGSCRMVLWEDNVGSLEAGKTYDLVDVTAKIWNGKVSIVFRAKFKEVGRGYRRCER